MFHDRTTAKLRSSFGTLVLALTGIAGSLVTVPPAAAADNGVGATPFMGWSSWSSFKKSGATMATVQSQANAMATSLRSFGYTYINIDAGWQAGYDGYGRPVADASKFPGGITAAAAYVHGKGLKIGIYLNPGIAASVCNANDPIFGTVYHAKDICELTVNGNTVGSFAAYGIDFSKIDANTGKSIGDEYLKSETDQFASWGVDFIKEDFVGPGGGNTTADDRVYMQHFLSATEASGRPVWIDLSNSLAFADAATWRQVANSWRIDGDIERTPIWGRILTRFTDAPKWAPFAGPGGWNNFDAIEVGYTGNGGLAANEGQTMMTLWAISCAPLFLGADMTKLSTADLALVTNPEVIAVDQAGHVATPLSQAPNQQVWRVKNPDGSFTVGLFNLDSTSKPVTVNWTDLGFSGTAAVRDLWSRVDLGNIPTLYSVTLPSHGSALIIVRPQGAGDYSMSATPASQTVTAGGSTSYTATVSSIGGFTDSVNLTVSGLPAGASGTFTPSTISGGSGTSTLAVTTSASTPAGNYTLTIHGTSGVLVHSTTVTLVVTGTPDFTLTLASACQSGPGPVVAGGSVTCTINIGALNGFTGSVALTVSGLPSGATGSFNPASVTVPGSSVLTISTSATTPPGSYTITVQAVSGTLSHSVSFVLKVTSVPPPCLGTTAGAGWTNTAFAAQTGTFTASWDAAPPTAPTNAPVGLSNGAQTANTGFAVIVSFSDTGNILALNGGTYAATNTIKYAAGVTYHFRVVVNITAHTYSVYVTPAGGTETQIASNYAFRTALNTVKTLNSVGSSLSSGYTGTFSYCSFAIQ